MTGMIERKTMLQRNRWRVLGWGSAMALLLTPLIAMQFTHEVNWTASDFAFAIIMFGTAGLLLEIALRIFRTQWVRTMAVLAIAAAFLLIWIDGAVGIF